MTRKLVLVFLGLWIAFGCTDNTVNTSDTDETWSLGILPASVRFDPATKEAIEYRHITLDKQANTNKPKLLVDNWVYKDGIASIYGARGEYVSFQVVIDNGTQDLLKNISMELAPFANENDTLEIRPELFLEWAVEVKTPSTGYPKSSLKEGWYPDALIPIEEIQMDSSKVGNRWTYPLTLPDFNNGIDHQKALIFWVDQYLPINRKDAKPGLYTSTIKVTANNTVREVPIKLGIWDFALPNENKLKAALQQEGFLSQMDEGQELQIYQLFKKNRIALLDPTYKPQLSPTAEKGFTVDWDSFDSRLEKYFSGEAFTKAYGYPYGPGYGEPIEIFTLPFDVYGKHHTRGWPDVGNLQEEQIPENEETYVQVIRSVHDHLEKMVNTDKTELTVYLNGLDESYFPEAWKRMVYYGELFKKEYPEARFRVDGAYTDEALATIGKSISAWGSHTIEYDIERIRKYQQMGIKDWLYGPLIYESPVNSWVGSCTFIDLPLVNDRAISWSCWKYGTYSWLSWGIAAGWSHSWYDPETWKDFYKEDSESDPEFTFRKFNGNASLIYKPGIVPNVNVPCPSIRLKTMRNGVQEYEYLRLLSTHQGKELADSFVDKLVKRPFGQKSIGTIEVWSYDPEKWDQTRIELGNQIEKVNAKK